MGIDLRIACRAKGEYEPPSPALGVDGEMSRGSSQEGATHELSSMTRYYGPHYERGPWPFIAAYLLELMADQNVEAIWYGGDDRDFLEPVTFEWLTQMNLHYADNGERPYRELGVERVSRKATVTIV